MMLLPLWLFMHGPSWEVAFPSGGGSVHYRASYVDAAGRGHELEVWRDGERRVRRRSDGRLDLLAERSPDGELAIALYDQQRGYAVRLTRSDLYRMGELTDWAGLAHALVRPRGAVTVTLGRRDAGCRWAQVGADQGDFAVCWSPRFGLPLRMLQGGREIWRVEHLEARVDPAVFALPATVASFALAVDGD